MGRLKSPETSLMLLAHLGFLSHKMSAVTEAHALNVHFQYLHHHFPDLSTYWLHREYWYDIDLLIRSLAE